jgi:uncharacterized membrane protein
VETHLRSVIKAVSWRTGGTLVTVAITWVVTGRLDLAVKVGVLETVVKIGAFYLHERIWNWLDFGKEKPPEYQI